MKRIFLCLAALFCLSAAAAALAGERGFIDDSGQEVRVASPHKRIISLYGAHTENLFSLGLDREIIGVSPHESHPPAALGKPVFSYRDDPERLLAARPDLVLIRPMVMRGYRGLVESLRQAGVAVVSLQPTGADDLLAYWRKLGLLTGREAQAQAMTRRFQSELARLKSRVAAIKPEERPRVYFESVHRRFKTFAPFAMSIFALEAAGGVNLAAGADSVRGSNIAEFGKERILSLAARLDVYLAQTGPMNRVSAAEIKSEPGFAALKAVRENRVHLVDEQLVSRPTLRLLQGVELLQGILYPRLTAGRDAAGARP